MSLKNTYRAWKVIGSFEKRAPEYLTELFRLTSEVHNYNLRGSKFDMQLPKPKTR